MEKSLPERVIVWGFKIFCVSSSSACAYLRSVPHLTPSPVCLSAALSSRSHRRHCLPARRSVPDRLEVRIAHASYRHKQARKHTRKHIHRDTTFSSHNIKTHCLVIRLFLLPLNPWHLRADCCQQTPTHGLCRLSLSIRNRPSSHRG